MARTRLVRPVAGSGVVGGGISLGLAAVAVIAAGIYFTRPKPAAPTPGPDPVAAANPPASTPTSTDTAPLAASAATAASSAATAQTAKVHIDTEPAGASVRLGDREGKELCKATPCDVELTGDDAKPGTEIKLFLVRGGYVQPQRLRQVRRGLRELQARAVADRWGEASATMARRSTRRIPSARFPTEAIAPRMARSID